MLKNFNRPNCLIKMPYSLSFGKQHQGIKNIFMMGDDQKERKDNASKKNDVKKQSDEIKFDFKRYQRNFCLHSSLYKEYKRRKDSNGDVDELKEFRSREFFYEFMRLCDKYEKDYELGKDHVKVYF